MKQNNSRKYKYSLFFDWIIVALVAVAVSLTDKIKLPERYFNINDTSISYPFKEDTIKMVYLWTFCFVGSIGVITLCQILKKRLNFDYNQTLTGLIFSYFLSTFIGNLIKFIVRRPRPHFLAICNVNYTAVEEQYKLYNNMPYGPSYLFNTSICTAPIEEVLKHTRSFPSGHSYTVASFMCYLALYIAGQIHLLDGKSKLWKYLLVVIPYVIVMVVAISRVTDYCHHWEDVTVGVLIGLVVSTLTYFYYYPSLRDKNCDIPYQSRKYEENPNNENRRNEYFVYE